MKKMLVLTLTLLILMTMASCAPTNEDHIEEDTEYNEEFPYLPSYDEEMELVEFKEGVGEDLDIGTYVIENTTPLAFLTRYEEILLEEEWENTLDNKPVSINMKKEDHIAIILVPPVGEGETNIVVLIYSN